MLITVWTGIAVGSIYVLTALALTIPYLASGVFNFAQPAVLALGTFLAYWLRTEHQMPIAVVIVASAAICFAVGAIVEILAIRPLAGSGVHGELVTTLGAAVIIEGVILRVWGPDPRRVDFLASTDTVSVLGGELLPIELLLIGVALISILVTHLVLRRTLVGLACLASAEDRQAAMLRGIDVNRLSMWAFAVAGALCGAIGVVVGAKTFAVFDLGNALVVFAFVALAIGGFGSVGGALIGGLAVGVIQQLTVRYLGIDWAQIVIFFVLVTVLLVRPNGLFGVRAMRTV